MSNIITLAKGQQLTLLSPNLDFVVNGQEVSFRYIGANSEPLPEHYPLFSCSLNADSVAFLLGDGFQMLAQTSGHISAPEQIGRCPDNDASYRIYPSDAPRRYYNYLMLEGDSGYTLFGFTSCLRFAGYFELTEKNNQYTVTAYIDGENSPIEHWNSNDLESVTVINGDSLNKVYQQYSQLLCRRHPPRAGVQQETPIGWCSWYAYYAEVNKQNVIDNVSHMEGELEALEWVLLDDGYQAYMGDWLTPSDKFPGGVKALIQNIKQQGKKPAIWMAPFIAQPESALFRQHPDWFVLNQAGAPLKAEEITYGGWRCTPWYILDTSNPEVQAHLTQVVKTMREEWGVELFKLDANYWGTLKGNRCQKGVTGVEAYRLGMQALAEGCGDAWLLGCNAPMWPSLGLVDAMRVSDDVERQPHRFQQIAKETFLRSWQHKQLWQIDPDCATFVSLANQGTEQHYYEFHRDILYTCGGLLLSGDPLPDLTPFARTSLTSLIERQNLSTESGQFTSLNLNHAKLSLAENSQLHSLFNYEHDDKSITITEKEKVYWIDLWSGEKLQAEPSQTITIALPSGPSSRLILAKKI